MHKSAVKVVSGTGLTSNRLCCCSDCCCITEVCDVCHTQFTLRTISIAAFMKPICTWHTSGDVELRNRCLSETFKVHGKGTQ